MGGYRRRTLELRLQRKVTVSFLDFALLLV